jgi:hypothetical protein
VQALSKRHTIVRRTGSRDEKFYKLDHHLCAETFAIKYMRCGCRVSHTSMQGVVKRIWKQDVVKHIYKED